MAFSQVTHSRRNSCVFSNKLSSKSFIILKMSDSINGQKSKIMKSGRLIEVLKEEGIIDKNLSIATN
jgi:hypothetical protein